MVSINRLQAEIFSRGGLAQPNRFSIVLPQGGEQMTIFCKQATLPGQQILTSERTVGITLQKIAYGYAHADVSLTFLLANDYFAKTYFEDWQRETVINDEGDDYHHPNYKENYVRDVTINQLDKNGEIVYTNVLVDAFPTTVNAIELSDTSANAPIELSVELSYTRWYTP